MIHKLIQSRSLYSKIGDRECRSMLERHITAEEAVVQDAKTVRAVAVDAKIMRAIAVVEAVEVVARIERSDVDFKQRLAWLKH